MSFGQVGFNYRMTEMQGALGVTQMRRLNRFIAQRRAVAALYDQLLTPLPVSIPYVPSGFGHVYQSYVVMLPESVDRDHVIAALRGQDIEVTIGAYAIHAQPYYRHKYRLTPDRFPNSAAAFSRGLALPIHQHMGEDDVRRVVAALAQALEGLRP
jgi:dTDP-4-amino-4,6-dideoxygalactose transaminase